MFSFDRREKDRDSGKEPALMKGAGGGTIEKIQNKNGGRRTLHSFAGK